MQVPDQVLRNNLNLETTSILEQFAPSADAFELCNRADEVTSVGRKKPHLEVGRKPGLFANTPVE